MTWLYAIGLGSNRRHGRHGAPAQVLIAAVAAMRTAGLRPHKLSPIITTAPHGPAGRRFANGAVLVETDRAPPALLIILKAIEHDFGRRPGRRWGARVLDLDVLLWSGGRSSSRKLAIPHRGLIARRFALDPLARIVPRWRIPRAGTVRQHAARLTRPRPVHRSGRRSGP